MKNIIIYITTAAGDRFKAVSLGSGNWAVYVYTRTSGQPVASGASFAFSSEVLSNL